VVVSAETVLVEKEVEVVLSGTFAVVVETLVVVGTVVVLVWLTVVLAGTVVPILVLVLRGWVVVPTIPAVELLSDVEVP
jgi:hypothetical protein